MAAYATTQSSPGLLDTLRNTWGSRGNAKPALGLDLDRSFEELQRPKRGFLRSVVASFCLAPAVHGERTPKVTDGLTDDEEDADSEATTEVSPPLSLSTDRCRFGLFNLCNCFCRSHQAFLHRPTNHIVRTAHPAMPPTITECQRPATHS